MVFSASAFPQGEGITTVGASEFTSVNPRLMQIIQRHMDNLRRSIDGEELFGLIGRILRRHGRQGPIDAPCFVELYQLLDAYANDPLAVPNARIKARLLQQHIALYLPDDGRPATAPSQVADAPVTRFSRSPAPMPDNIDIEPARVGTLHARLSAAQERRQRYEALHRSEQDAWRAIYGVARDFNALKTVWNESLDEISADRNRLEEKMANTEVSLQSLEASARELRADLDSARQAPARKTARRLPRLARGTGARLVTREIFMQQLQAEVSRLRRSGGAATLALLAIRELDTIAHTQGDGAEVAVLNCYAREILAGFRAYDIIARHDDAVFAVLLPDTGQDGALRALEKAQKRAAQSHVGHDGRRFSLPPFRAALTVYVGGEEPLQWWQRAQSTIERAQHGDTDLVVA
jgi:GGDEF domain-containing protein